MKKNKMMRLASVLLVLTLLTTSVISGTFAKYTVTKSAGDSARVAHWGVAVTVSGDQAFKTEYNGTASATNTDTVTVKSSTLKKLVAPGTDGTLATVDITGSPEVDAAITFNATVTISDWIIDHDGNPETAGIYYCPLIVTVGSDKLVGNSYDSAADFATAIKEKIDAYSGYYNAHSDTTLARDVDVTWKWNISTNTDDAEQTDVLDTVLGNLAATEGDNADYIQLALTVTVEQVD